MIDDHDIVRLDERYVQKDNCRSNVNTMQGNIGKFDTRIAVFEEKIKLWEKLFWTVAGASLGQLGVSILNLLKG